jgi:signal transduction histidine kinase
MDGRLAVSSIDKNPLYWSKELGGRFLWIASFLYLAALGTNLVYVLSNECGFAFMPGRPEMFIGIILGLLILEWWSYQHYGPNMTRQAGIWLLVVRIILFEIAASLDCSSFAIFLYILLPFLAHMFINKWAAITLGVVFTTWVGIKFEFFRCPNCPIDQNITPVLIIGVAMLWSNAMGGLVKGVEISRARTKQLFADLERSHQKLKEYAARVEDLAAAEERNRVARDIHDSVGHSLAVVNVQLEKALVFHRRDADVTEQAMKDARRAAKQALGDVRESVRTLRQSAEAFSLTEALTSLVGRSKSEALEVNLQVDGSEAGYSKPALMTLYRAAQEALTNIHKHAGASQVEIAVYLGDESARLQVQDNGIGFELERVKDLPVHREGQYGLQGIRERLELVGGEMSLESGPAIGTVLTVTIPKQRLTDPSGAKADDE